MIACSIQTYLSNKMNDMEFPKMFQSQPRISQKAIFYNILKKFHLLVVDFRILPEIWYSFCDVKDVHIICLFDMITDITGMGDSAKRGGWPALKLFTVILCGPNFVVY